MIVNSNHIPQFKIDEYGGMLYFVKTGYFHAEDENQNTIDLRDLVTGVITDDNGIPRNIVSNLIF